MTPAEAAPQVAYEQAREGLRSGEFAKADRLLTGLLAGRLTAELRARCLTSKALAVAELGAVEDGIALCRAALAVRRVSPLARGLAQAQLALLFVRAGDRAQAFRAFARAEPLLGGEPAELASLHLNRGVLSLNLEAGAQAARDFRAAMEQARLSEDPVLIAKARFNLGMAEACQGNLVVGLRHLEAVAPILNPLSRNYEAVGESCLGEVLAASGLLAEAAAKFDRSARIFGAEGLRQDQAEMELLWAQLMSRADPVASRRRARRAAARFAQRGADDYRLRAEVAELATLRVRDPRLVGRAEELHYRAKVRGLVVEAATCALHAAAAHAAAGRQEEASSWMRRSSRLGRGATRGADPIGLRLQRAQVRAVVALARGEPAAARAALRAGLTELHEWLSGFGSAELQATLLGHGRELAQAGLDLAVDDGRAAVLFDWFERARVLVSRVSPVRSPSAPEAAEELAALRGLHAEGRDDEALRERIRRHAWYAPAIGPAAQPARLSGVRRELARSGAGLIAFVVARGRLVALVVTPGGTQIRQLGPLQPVTADLGGLRADLDMVAGDLPGPFARLVREGLQQRLAGLDALLLGPLRDLLDRRPRWVLVPAGALAGIPWSLLPSLTGRPFTLARSATHWARAGTHWARSATHWAGPVTQTRAAAETGPARAVAFVTGPRVARAADEVAHAAAAWPPGAASVCLLASAAATSQVAARADVLHVAAHGRHASDNPLFSGLELSDGPWFGYDIDQLDAVPQTVILSACELGRSQVRGAEELLGMTTAWLHAGVRTVIASPALVNDEAAHDLLPRVHRRLAEGAAPAVALAEAQAEVAATGALPAPFACFGAGW